MLYQRGKAYSQDLRERVFATSDDGERVGEIAELLRVSVAYVSKALTRRRTTGETTVRAQHGHKLPKLAPFYAAIRTYVAERGDTTIAELRTWLLATHQVAASVGLIWHTFERWLTAPMEKDGERTERTRGTPQGGVISPVLSNLFLHYAFDLWMARTHPDLPWCRYADDGLVHCRTEKEAEALRAELQARLAVCGLQMHPTKTQIVYCKDNRRRRTYPNVKFLGYQFRPRRVATAQRNEYFCGYTPAVSPAALKSMRETIRSLRIPRQTPGTLAEIAQQINPLLRGWIDMTAGSAVQAWHRWLITSIRS